MMLNGISGGDSVLRSGSHVKNEMIRLFGNEIY